ncbi:MAG: protease modulator HflC, partial [Proteobacteria bacterium]
MFGRATPWVFGIAIVLILCSTALFQVKETEVAFRTRFGEIRGNDYGPGLHVKWPFVENVV